MGIEAINEFRIEAGAVPRTERPLSVAKIISSRFSRSRLTSRVAGAVVGAIASFGSGIGLDIVEGLGGVMEKAYYKWLDRAEGRYMKELRRIRY